jgi:segregation and condensation protein A
VNELEDSFEIEAPAREDERLTLDLDGWEGPLDLLLTLARAQKVDLARISILALVEQYLAFIADAKKLRLEIAADYLVMAAWLAYLKSCLLLPKDPTIEPGPEELRCGCSSGCSASRRCARPRAADRAATGSAATSSCAVAPEGLRVVRRAAWTTDLYDLISAYGIVRARNEPAVHVVARRPVMTLDEAIHRLERMIGTRLEWTALESFCRRPRIPNSAVRHWPRVSSRHLELARLGKVQIEQKGNFATLYVRAA